MYDQDEINALSILYITFGKEEDFRSLLHALIPMINKILLRFPDFSEFYDDIRQDVLLCIWKNWKNIDKLRNSLEDTVPVNFFFFKVRGFMDSSLTRISKHSKINCVPIDSLLMEVDELDD